MTNSLSSLSFTLFSQCLIHLSLILHTQWILFYLLQQINYTSNIYITIGCWIFIGYEETRKKSNTRDHKLANKQQLHAFKKCIKQ